MKVIFSSPFVPAEWIAAHGLVPSRGACPGNDGGMPVDVTSGVCPYMRSFVNRAAEDPGCAAIVLTTSCDQMRRGADLVTLRTEKPCFLMHVPSTSGSSSVQLYMSELERLGKFLVGIGGAAPDAEKLAFVMADHNRKRSALLSLREMASPRRYAQMLDRFYDTGEITLDQGPDDLSRETVPVGMIGGPLTDAHFDIFDILEDNGANVVVNGTETGVRTFPARFDMRRLKSDTMRVLAESYFGAIPDIFERPNNRIYLWVKQMIEERAVRGMVLVRYVWCDKWKSEVWRFREWLPVRLLDIELDGGRIDERTKNRIQAFAETLP